MPKVLANFLSIFNIFSYLKNNTDLNRSDRLDALKNAKSIFDEKGDGELTEEDLDSVFEKNEIGKDSFLNSDYNQTEEDRNKNEYRVTRS